MRKDHTFLLKLHEEEKLAFAFCSSSKLDKHSAKEEINQILMKKGITNYQLSYLGSLDYSDMDPDITSLLHSFEKYENVWLLL